MDEKVIVCNHKGNHFIRAGARAYLLLPNRGNDYDNVYLFIRTRSGRYIKKWENFKNLYNFREVTKPPQKLLKI